jgi:hypothetical protein
MRTAVAVANGSQTPPADWYPNQKAAAQGYADARLSMLVNNEFSKMVARLTGGRR